MLIRDIRDARYFTASDGTTLCELLHPHREPDAPPLACSLAHARLAPGASSLPHRLRTSTEVFYVLEGAGDIIIDDERAALHPGQAVCVPPGAVQWLQNTGPTDLVVLCLVSPPWCADDEEVLACLPDHA